MTSNPNSPDFDYKKYSLEKLQEWVHDALSCGEASPHEIYSAIREAVREDYYYYKDHCSRAFGLLERLSGHRPVKEESYDLTATGEKFPASCDKDDKSPECQKSWNDFWEECYYPEEYESHDPEDYKNCPTPPWGRGDSESRYPEPNQKQYTEEELNAMCEQAASEAEKQKCREYNLREAEYYDKRAQLDLGHSKYYYDYTRNDSNRKNPFENVKKWVLPVEETKIAETDETEYFVSFPDDLLEAANLKEGDQVEWIDRGNGSYQLKKVKKPMTYEEAYAAGWTMTDDGIWWPPQDAKTVSMDEC